MTTRGETLHSVRGQAIRRRQIAYRLLDRLDALSFVPSLGWLKALRVALVLAAITCYGAGWLYSGAWWFQALLAVATWIAVEIAMFRVALVEVAKGWRE